MSTLPYPFTRNRIILAVGIVVIVPILYAGLIGASTETKNRRREYIVSDTKRRRNLYERKLQFEMEAKLLKFDLNERRKNLIREMLVWFP